MKPSSILAIACSFLGLLTLPPSARAEAELKHPIKPLLWKVEGKGMTKPSYLFGTIHIGKGPAVTLHPAAQEAFDAASNFYSEVPLDTESQMATLPLMMRQDGKTLDEAIGKELAAELNAELKRVNPVLDSTPFQAMATWAAAILPQMLPHQIEGGKPLDVELWNKAALAGKKAAGMEKPEAQLIAFTELTEAEQNILLSETLKKLAKDRAAGKDSIREIIAAYVSGEPAKVAAVIDLSIREIAEGDHREIGQKLMKRLINDRDKTMADFIATTLGEQPAVTHFFAAGAGHFCSEGSIPSHLQKAGYTVTRIEK